MVTTIASAARKTRPSKVFRQGRLPRIPAEAHTLPGFLAWIESDGFPEKVRTTFIDGEVILEMPKEEIQTHASPKGEIFWVLSKLNREIDFGNIYTDGVLIVNEEANVSNNPDGVALLWESLDSGRVKFVSGKAGEMYIQGSPDWVMEIISKSSVGKDTRKLRAAYQRAKIPEYWLIDCRGDEIKFHILYWRKSGYVAAPIKDGWQHSKVFGFSFRLLRKRDRRGAWKYELQMKRD
jgi:Uma2 family endonuclease